MSNSDSWRVRVENLLEVKLPQSISAVQADWKTVYNILLPVIESRETVKYTDEVLLNPLAVEVLLESGEDPSAENNYAIRQASKLGNVAVVRLLLSDPHVDPAVQDNYAIGIASHEGHTEVVKLLLADKRVDPSTDNNYAIQVAAQRGYSEVVKLLLSDSSVDPSAENNYAIRLASSEGHSKVVELLLADQRVDPTVSYNYPIRLASRNGHSAVVKLLLSDSRVDPTAEDNYAIKRASTYGHLEVVRLLLADTRTDPRVAINLAYKNEHIDVLSLLLSDERVDLQEVSAVIYDAFSDKLSTSDFNKDHYYILLREVLLKNEDIKYYLEWLVEQCKRHPQALEFRRVIAQAAESFFNTGTVVHTSPLFTAYSGFLLLAKIDSSRAILNLLKKEKNITREGLNLARELLEAFTGEKNE